MQTVTTAALGLVLARSAVAASLPTLASRQSTSACEDVHIFLAKGNNEPYPGRQGALADAICNGVDSCDYENILYYNPAPAPYCDSVDQGVQDGIDQITAYNARCPNAELVVSGYSQGAQIVSDILAGGGGHFFQDCLQNTSAGLDVNSAVGKKIAAALVFGNVRHTANQPYNQFSGASHDGLYPRSGEQAEHLLTWTAKFHDYCVVEDPVCAQGDNISDHLNYFDLYTDSSAAWVKSMIAAAQAAEAAGTTTTVMAPTVTPSVGNASVTVTHATIVAIPTESSSDIVTVSSASVATKSLTALSSISATATTTTSNAIPYPTSSVVASAYGSGVAAATGSSSSSGNSPSSYGSGSSSSYGNSTSSYGSGSASPSGSSGNSTYSNGTSSITPYTGTNAASSTSFAGMWTLFFAGLLAFAL